MFSIAICDDEERICSDLETLIYQKESQREVIQVQTYYDGKHLINDLLAGCQFHLILLDIEMEDVNGISVARTVRNELKDDLTQLVFVSSKQKYAMKLFEFRPLNFLTKPVKRAKLFTVLDKARELSERQQDCFTFTQYGVTERIPYGKILYFCSSGKYLRVITQTDELQLRKKLSDIMPYISQKGFVQIHQSYAVNSIHVKKYTYTEIELFSEKTLSISQPYRKQARNLWLEIMQGREK